MNFGLIELIKGLLSFSMGESIDGEINIHGRTFKLSFNNKADTINKEWADSNLRTTSGLSYFTMYFNDSLYKVKQYESCNIVKNDLTKLTSRVSIIEIEKCHSIK